MSTRCNIAIILRPDDRNRTLNVMDPAFDCYRPNMKSGFFGLRKSEDLKNIFPDCKPNGNPVLQIYCHCDGYPEGVGEALHRGYRTYEEALALVLGGDLSCLKESYSCPYSIEEGEDSTECAPIVLQKAKLDEQYLYVFDYKTDSWYVQDQESVKLMSLSHVLYRIRRYGK